jgi:CRP/FNR family transcriptional regulator, cyclic AMP receptor protein
MISEQQLALIPLVKGLSKSELRELASVMTERKVEKGCYILHAEDPGPSLMFVAEGEVKIVLIGNYSKEIVLARLSQGDFFGEIAILTGEDRSANVIAMENCILFVLSREDFNKHVLTNSGLALAMLRELATRLRAASSKIGDLALFDVSCRVAKTLKSIAKVEIICGQEVSVIEKRPTQNELASMVGTSREVVSRVLKGLEDNGYLEIDKKRVIIKKMPL